MDVQICFTYSYTNDTLCTWRDEDASSHASVIRIPHAFGDGFPTAAAGPGQVALWTGEFNTTATDVTVPAYTGTLSLSRTYSAFAGGTEDSVFGVGWAPSFEGSDLGAAGLAVLDSTGVNGMIALEDVDGTYLLYREPGGGTVAQQAGAYDPFDDDTAQAGYRLSLTGAGTSARLALIDDKGVTTTWAQRDAGEWDQISVTEPGGASTTFTYDTDGRVVQILAPVPEGVSCDTGLVAGCRALEIAYYDTTDAATGAYVGRVHQVSYHAWDSQAGTVVGVPVAAYRYDTSGRLVEVTDPRSGRATTYSYSGTTGAGVPRLTTVTPSGLAPWTISYGTSSQGESSVFRVARASALGDATTVPVRRFVYGIDLSTPPAGSPDVQTAANAWGQSREPAAGFAVFDQGEDPGGSGVAQVDSEEWLRADVQYTDAEGYTVNTATYGAGRWLYTATEYDTTGNVVRELDTAAADYLIDQAALNSGQAVAEAEVNAVAAITRYNKEITATEDITWDGGTIAADAVLVPAGTRVTDTWTPATDGGGQTRARIHTHYDYDQGAPNYGVNPRTGQKYSLVTTTTTTEANEFSGHWDLSQTVATGEDLLERSTTAYDPIDGAPATGDTSGWTLGAATVTTLVMDDPGDNIVTKTRYDSLGRVVETRAPASDGTDAGTDITIYYTATENTIDVACGDRPEWAGLVCVTRSAETTPTVPVVRTIDYSLLLAATETTETLGGVTRTSTTHYLADGRIDSTALTVTGLSGSTPLPTTHMEYDSATGLATATVTKDAANNETGRIATSFDLWGRTDTYTASNGDTATSEYDTGGRLWKVNDGHHMTEYTYDEADAVDSTEHRGLPTSMTVSGVGSFTATYDAAGNMARQTMPGGITQVNTYSLTGEPTSLTYTGLDSGGETIPLIGWTQVSDLFGRVIAENTPTGVQDPSSVGEYSRTYTYDRAGRLTLVEDRTEVDPVSRTGTWLVKRPARAGGVRTLVD